MLLPRPRVTGLQAWARSASSIRESRRFPAKGLDRDRSECEPGLEVRPGSASATGSGAAGTGAVPMRPRATTPFCSRPIDRRLVDHDRVIVSMPVSDRATA
jgi:hypothetical protein